MNAEVAAGFQLRFVDEQAALKGIALLPLLLLQLQTQMKKEYPSVRICVEAASVSLKDGLRTQLRHGLNVRLCFPPDASAAAVSELCLDVQDDLLHWLNRGEKLCRFVRSAEEGTVHLIPPSAPLHFLTKARYACQTESGGLLHYSPRFFSASPVGLAAVSDVLRQYPGCGMSLQLIPADDAVCDALKKVAGSLPQAGSACADLMQIASADARYSVQAAVFGRDSLEAARALLKTLEVHGLACRLLHWTREEMAYYQLIHDPWALNKQISSRFGGKLAFTASLLCGDELAALLDGQDAVPPDEKPAGDEGRIEIRLTDEELAALGVQDEDGLLERGMTQEQIGQLCTAASLARFALANETLPSLVSYAAPLGIFYEMIVRACLENTLLAAENDYRKDMQPDYRKREEEAKLSHFDFISYSRVRNYENHVRFGRESLSGLCWTVWFNCLKYMRLTRNKMHTQIGEVTREELEHMYRMMLFPGHEHKLGALRYAIAHPHPKADDNENRNLKILHSSRTGTPEDLLWYISNNPALFEESLLSFILRCAGAQWVSS